MIKKYKTTKATPKIYIEISTTTRMKLKKIQNKYKVSMSNIAEKTSLAFVKELLKYNEETYKTMLVDYLDKEAKKQTCIKPKYEYDPFKTNEDKIHFISNALYLYANKEIAKIIPEKEIQEKIYNKINSELQKSRETWWDLNNAIRTNKRALVILGASEK